MRTALQKLCAHGLEQVLLELGQGLGVLGQELFLDQFAILGRDARPVRRVNVCYADDDDEECAREVPIASANPTLF